MIEQMSSADPSQPDPNSRLPRDPTTRTEFASGNNPNSPPPPSNAADNQHNSPTNPSTSPNPYAEKPFDPTDPWASSDHLSHRSTLNESTSSANQFNAANQPTQFNQAEQWHPGEHSHSRRAVPIDPPVVVPPDYPDDPLSQGWLYLVESLSEPAYGASRVFDLFTLMAITLAFGMLFGAMKALGANPEAFFGVTTFVTLVAVGQMLLFGGKNPRLASVVGGPFVLVLTVIMLDAIWFRRFDPTYLCCTFPLGAPAGYLAGGMVAGVFLIADEIRKRYPSKPTTEEDENFWDRDS